MKNVSAFLMLFSGGLLCAQVDSEGEKIPNPKRMQFGITLSPDISGRILYNVDGSELSESFVDFFSESEVPKFSYTAGAILMVYLSERFSLETGLHYANRGFGTKFFDMTYFSSDPAYPEKFRNTYSLQCLDIPAKLQYGIKMDKSRFFITAGFAVNIVVLSSEKSVQVFKDGSRETNVHTDFVTDDFFNLSPCAGFGMEYFIGKKSSLTVSPVFRFTAFGYGNESITSRIWSTGIQTSFLF